MWQEFLPATEVASEQTLSGCCTRVSPGCCKSILDRRGNGRLQDVLRALQWISVNQNLYGIRIINISVGAAAMDSKAAARLIKAVEQAWDQGFVVVTAAGNMGPAYGSVTAPGSSKKSDHCGSK